MKVLQEQTDWQYPNHIYFVNNSKDKMLAYIKVGTDNVVEFSKPLGFATKGRKFVEVENTFDYQPDDKPDGFVRYVTGSKGEKYTITKVNNQLACSCAGFRFRSTCKHIAL